MLLLLFTVFASSSRLRHRFLCAQSTRTMQPPARKPSQPASQSCKPDVHTAN